MNSSQQPVPEQRGHNSDFVDAPHATSTSDYGTLGPGSDVQAGLRSAPAAPARPLKSSFPGPVFAVAIGVFFALLVGNIGKANAGWSRFANLFAARGDVVRPAAPSVEEPRQLDRMKPQKQAEALLELAVKRSGGAVDQISSRLDRWQGKLKWTPQIATLTTAALNSSDMRVRESGIEVELAAYGLGKNSASLDYLMQSAGSADHAQKIWGLWALGLMGNRGFETARVVETLTAHLKDADQDSRQWTVEGLSIVGTPEAISLLLTTMHDDPSAAVRERAACGIAASGMFDAEERLAAVPQLVNFSDDPALDARTHALAFQALAEITHQRLPNKPEAWRTWYESKN
jgi:hypothetical protein